jgi:hypothetical protein
MSLQSVSHVSPRANVGDKQVVVEPVSNRKELNEIRKARELPEHQARRDSRSESSSGKGKGPGLPKPEVGGDEPVEINQAAVQQPEGDVKIAPEKTPGKMPLTQSVIDILTVTPAQEAEHREARSEERCGMAMVGFCGLMTLIFAGALVYGLVVGGNAESASVSAAVGLAGVASCLVVCLYYLYQILRSKGCIPHAERNLR